MKSEEEHLQPRKLVKSPKVLDATATRSSPVAHDDVLERFVELVSSGRYGGATGSYRSSCCRAP